MPFVQSVRQNGLRLADALRWLPPFATRLCLGLAFVLAGYNHIRDLEQLSADFRARGLPAAQLQATLSSTFELLFGALLLVGLFTRLSTLPLIAILVMAIATARRSELAGPWLDQLQALAGMLELLAILLLLWLAIFGPGPLSLDRALGGGGKRR